MNSQDDSPSRKRPILENEDEMEEAMVEDSSQQDPDTIEESDTVFSAPSENNKKSNKSSSSLKRKAKKKKSNNDVESAYSSHSSVTPSPAYSRETRAAAAKLKILDSPVDSMDSISLTRTNYREVEDDWESAENGLATNASKTLDYKVVENVYEAFDYKEMMEKVKAHNVNRSSEEQLQPQHVQIMPSSSSSAEDKPNPLEQNIQLSISTAVQDIHNIQEDSNLSSTIDKISIHNLVNSRSESPTNSTFSFSFDAPQTMASKEENSMMEVESAIPSQQQQQIPTTNTIDGFVDANGNTSSTTTSVDADASLEKSTIKQEEQEKQIIEFIPPPLEKNEHGQILYCLCKQPDDEIRPMIACDSCNNWFHLGCVSISSKEATQIESYICATCAEATKKQTKLKEKKPRGRRSQSTPEKSGTIATVSNASTLEASIKTTSFAEVRELDAEKEKEDLDKNQAIDEHSQMNVGNVELDCLSEYDSLMDRKVKKKGNSSASFGAFGKSSLPSFENATEQHILKSIGKSVPNYTIKKYKQGTYINCDLRYFNLNSIGKFDVIMIDPAWRISGANKQNEHSNMFSNNGFKLNYNTMSNEEIIDLDVESVSDSGFIFLWVLNSTLNFGLSCLNKWGYTYIDRLVWIKKSKLNNTTLQVTHGYYFLHSTEICLVGVKYKNNEKSNRLQYISKVTNDVIFAKIGLQSQKPESIYQIIDTMFPGSRKIELFAKNHNIHEGWLSLGNRLGPEFDQTSSTIYYCSTCSTKLCVGTKRFKSKKVGGLNYCETCYKQNNSQKEEDEFYMFSNDMEEAVYHDWFTCDNCGQYPICGIRFSCLECEEFDLCEDCYDHILVHRTNHPSLQQEQQEMTETKQMEQQEEMKQEEEEEIKKEEEEEKTVDEYLSETALQHKCKLHFEAVEVPDTGAGFPVHHHIRCAACFACPIIGERFRCNECKEIDLCRNCFFFKKEPKTHLHTHHMDIIPEPSNLYTQFKCAYCKHTELRSPIYKCSTCTSLILCNQCHALHPDICPIERHVMHKPFHTFYKIK